MTKSTGDYISYIYDATGGKLRQEVYNSGNVLQKSTDYIGEFIYENNILQFINTEEGRVVMTGTNPEYQYHMKDHLGNVRMTFTTKRETEANTGTLETVNAASEQSKFLRYDNAKRVYSTLLDHTNGAAIGYAERLNGSANEKYGLARSISVMPGDTVNMEVYAKYIDPTTSNWTAALTTLMGQISSGTAGVVVDGAAYPSSTSSFPWAGALSTSGSSGAGPKAYLNWLVFDKNFVLLNGGYMRMTTAAKEAGSDVPHEKLSGQILVTEPGYVYAYLSNEETTPVEVYFDDFKVTQIKSPIIQSDDYYAFGLTFNSYSRENAVPNRYQYNGKETIADLGLNWDDFGARMYMPEIGRWGVVDPMAEKSRRWTPYRYGFNNPIRFIDPDGMFEYSNGYSTSDSKNETGAVEHYGSFEGTADDLKAGSSARATVVATTADGKSSEVPMGQMPVASVASDLSGGDPINTKGSGPDPLGFQDNGILSSQQLKDYFGKSYLDVFHNPLISKISSGTFSTQDVIKYVQDFNYSDIRSKTGPYGLFPVEGGRFNVTDPSGISVLNADLFQGRGTGDHFGYSGKITSGELSGQGLIEFTTSSGYFVQFTLRFEGRIVN